MTIQDDIPSLFAYTRWADGRIVDAVRLLTPEQFQREPVPGWTSVRSTLFHAGIVMTVWARGLAGAPYDPIPAEADFPGLDDVERLLGQGHDAFDRLIAGLTPERLASIWEGLDPRGTRRRLPLWAAYRHIANHATYHRGQIASKLKRLGVDPPLTDLVFWALECTPQADD